MAKQPISDYGAVFRAFPSATLIMDVDLCLQDANPAYLAATNRDLDDLVGRYIFDAFPQNPHYPEGDGVQNLAASFRCVLTSRQPHSPGVQRYDVPWSDTPDGFVERYWLPNNTPLIDAAGHLIGILHVAEDVTGFHDDLVAAQEFYRAEIRSQRGDNSGRRFAEYAKVAMNSIRSYTDVVAEVEQLREALSSRATIEQAKGIVMTENRCGPDEAFDLLARTSQAANIKVRDLAAVLVARGSQNHVSRNGGQRRPTPH